MKSSVGRLSDGRWRGTSVFREEGQRFIDGGYYCDAVKGSQGYKDYWDEQLRRCRQGYKVGDCKITGNHYFYLNFCPIELTERTKLGKANKKVTGFPHFWDFDYEYFWWLEIARFGVLGDFSQAKEMLSDRERKALESGKYDEEGLLSLKEDIVYNRLGLRLRTPSEYLDGGHHFIVCKARRKGFTYKNTALMVNTYNTERNSQCVFGVAQKDLGDQGMKFVSTYLSFLNKNTAWGKRREFIDTRDHKRASFQKIMPDGSKVEEGYKSEIILSSFMNNSEATRGKSPSYMLYEEAGTFTNLLDVWAAAIPSMEDGDNVTGMSVIFGTGGEISNKTGEFAKMFYNPVNYNIMPFYNIWDEGMGSTLCGFFFSAAWDYVGFYDDEGNSDIDVALDYIKDKRKKKLETATSADDYQKLVIEFPICPKESFLVAGRNIFNIPKLETQLARVRADGLQFKKGICVKLYWHDENTVKAKPILDGSAEPIVEYEHKNSSLRGCPIIYEYPINDPPRGLYKIGYDPYAQENATTTSLGAIIVYKGVHKGDSTRNIIVAEYIGRPDTSDEMDEAALMFAVLYNTEVMYENNVNHTISYFRRRHRLDRLALQPDRVINKTIKGSSVSRKYGCHLDGKLKVAGEEYVKEYLLNVIDYDENGEAVTAVDYIYSIGLLEELIKYFRGGNFDRVCALFQVMFQIQDEEMEKEYGGEKDLKTMSKELESIHLFQKKSSIFGIRK